MFWFQSRIFVSFSFLKFFKSVFCHVCLTSDLQKPALLCRNTITVQSLFCCRGSMLLYRVLFYASETKLADETEIRSNRGVVLEISTTCTSFWSSGSQSRQDCLHVRMFETYWVTGRFCQNYKQIATAYECWDRAVFKGRLLLIVVLIQSAVWWSVLSL